MYDPIWVCRDGRKMKVGDMSHAHLLNAIRYIEQRKRFRREWLPRLKLELVIRKVR